ncbi:inositol monophosphatase family protein [Variovorax sp. JS1663]|uniref:inositol monophosphatase family protein n=1 Tax=Variovorax sp. JS1663 TaxID=1851577 RepID=UPI000B3473D3|nr:inositol monophosphatase family protein [Variovorax sp. JS1663]OUL99813.1 inositol monophosphatase [Variovorax sp. JS1663]
MQRRFTIADLDVLLRAIAAAASDEVLPRFRRVQASAIRQKTSAFDIVTEADEAAECAIAECLASAFPGAEVIGEEAAGRDPRLLDRIGSAELAFVIDPLDGTKNFASGVPLFGVMGAVLERGEVVAGVIHDPVCRSSALAFRGAGAWLVDAEAGRTALRVAAPVPVHEMEGVAGTNFLPEPLRSTVNANLSRLGMTCWLRCAAHEYRLAAAGHCHVLFYNRLMPWDHAAGWLIHREAGGYSAHFDGSGYLPSHTSGGLLCTPDEASWQAVRQALFEAHPPAARGSL